MGQLIDSVMSGDCFVAPSDTRVLQAIVDGIVVGECFEFLGRPKPNTEEFKKEVKEFYPSARFKRLKDSRKAVGVCRWVKVVGAWVPHGGEPSADLVDQVYSLKGKWEADTSLRLYKSNQAEAEYRLRLAQRVIAGSLSESEAIAMAKHCW